jgi:hypothetical protein
VPLRGLALALFLPALLWGCDGGPAAEGCSSDDDCTGGRCDVPTGVCLAWPARDASVPDLAEPVDLSDDSGQNGD